MEVHIRQEEPADYTAVFNLIEKAFSTLDISDHKEQFLVERLRKSDAFIPALSLVAEYRDVIVGHILLTKLKIKSSEDIFHSLALAPVSVLPEYQSRGIGGKLINRAHEKARELLFKSVILIGHETYYPRFGYQQADKFGITFPFDVPAQNCMVVELVEGGLNGVGGVVEYPAAFDGG